MPNSSGILLLLASLLSLALWLLWSISQESQGQSKTLLSILTELRKGTQGEGYVESVAQLEILGEILQELRKRAVFEPPNDTPTREDEAL